MGLMIQSSPPKRTRLMPVRDDRDGGWRRLQGWRAWIAALLLVASLIALTSPAVGAEKSILIYGDSLMAGYGLPSSDAFMAQLQRALDETQLNVRLVNASVSGDTTASGLARLDWAMADRPDAVILGLGANDMLQGLPVETARRNLAAILDRLRAEDIPVLLAGMMANRGLGPEYVASFDSMYPELAAEYGAVLYPFFLQEVALEPALNQHDLRHPNAAGVKVIVSAMMPYVEQLLHHAE
jgi:acyl-CoA thioesterase-1